MEFIKQWTLCVCVTLIISTIFVAIFPGGKMKTFYKMTISVFILVSLLHPFCNFNINDFQIPSTRYISSSADNSYQQMIDSKITQVLKNNDIIGSDVNSDVTVSNNEIEINSVQIAISDEYDTNEVHGIIFNELGINAKVIHIGE